MSAQADRTCWEDGVKTDLESAALTALRDKYLVQNAFKPDTPVYDELRLAKLVTKEPIKSVAKDQASLTKNTANPGEKNGERSSAIPKAKRPRSVIEVEQDIEIISFKRAKVQGIRNSIK